MEPSCVAISRFSATEEKPPLPLEVGRTLRFTADEGSWISLNDLYTMTVPVVGGETPTISVAWPGEAAFPVWKLTNIGAQFPAWDGSGDRVHWSIGNAHFV